jgi:plasmid stabilization system protein ParE
MAKGKKIVWSFDALDQLEKALTWISQNSPSHAEILEVGILEKVSQASLNPERFPPDKYKLDNLGNFRCFTVHKYRVSFKVSRNEIRILRIRHVKQKPESF